MNQYLLRSGVLDRQRKLILAENYLEFENKDLKGHEFTRLDKADISDFKHGTEWLVWYKFTVGQQFSITFKDKRNKELRIVFKTYFGSKEYYQMYSNIVDDIWEFYHKDVVNHYLDKFYNNDELLLQGLKLSQQGIQLRGQNSILPWERICMKEYVRYFAVYDRENPELHSRVSYNEYETEILWGITRSILKNRPNNSQE